MTKLCKRFGKSKGETLVETLSAVLIVALTSVLLLSLTMTSAKLNRQSAEFGKRFQTELAAAEQGGGDRKGTVTILVPGNEYKYDVVYSGSQDQLFSYETKGGGEP